MSNKIRKFMCEQHDRKSCKEIPQTATRMWLSQKS